DVPAALFRGRYAKTVAVVDAHGLPVDADGINDLAAHWHALRMFYIRRDDQFGLYDDKGSFREDRFEAIVKVRGWAWPRTATGKLALNGKTFGKQCKYHPELRSLQKPDRRITFGCFSQHNRRRRYEPMSDHAVLDA